MLGRKKVTNIIQKFYKYNPITGDAFRGFLNYRTYKKTNKFLNKSQWWSKEQLEQYQLTQLKKLLNHVYENVPYYKKLFKKLDLKPNNFQELKDIKKLPYLTKQIVKENFNDFKAKNFSKKKFELIHSGGSTGRPLSVYVERGVAEANYIAYNQNLLDNFNCHFTNKQCHLIGNENIYKNQAFGRVLILSSFFMNNKNLSLFVKKIKKLKPRYIIGFPSAILILAKFMNNYNIKSFPSVRAIICSGETIYQEQRDIIEKTFQCRVYGYFSHVELVIFSTSCNYNNNYHVFPQYGITELVDKNNNMITKGGEEGEIIGTGFINPIFPLLRYRTGDIGVLAKQKCKCGRNYLMLKNIIGRKQDYIVSKSHNLIPLTGVYGFIAKSSKNLKECQFYQEKEGEINLRIVKEENFTEKDEKLIIENFKKKFQDEFKLIITYKDEIPRTPRGKYRYLIQKLPIEF
jgi:phenylacetate-CoA ligase